MEEIILMIGEILIVLCIVGTLYELLQIYKYIQKLERKLIKWTRFYKQELLNNLAALNRIKAGVESIDSFIEEILDTIVELDEAIKEMEADDNENL